jgi:hypothetical protein
MAERPLGSGINGAYAASGYSARVLKRVDHIVAHGNRRNRLHVVPHAPHKSDILLHLFGSCLSPPLGRRMSLDTSQLGGTTLL